MQEPIRAVIHAELRPSIVTQGRRSSPFSLLFAPHDAPPLLLLDAVPRLPGARSPFLAARRCLGYPAAHLCAGTRTATPIASNTLTFVASSLFHNTRNGRVDVAMFGAKEAQSEATRLSRLIWPPACVSGYPGGLRNAVLPGITGPRRLLRVVIEMLQRRNPGALSKKVPIETGRSVAVCAPPQPLHVLTSSLIPCARGMHVGARVSARLRPLRIFF